MAAAGVLSWLICAKLVMAAVFDESKAVPYQDYAASHTIEDATLFIGTYLIHAQAMTDELYEKAMESAADSNQTNIYYKSELASGAWIDITDAGGLSDIAGQGILVEESELAELWVSCCTGSDGITVDARDGQQINIFQNPSPYDLYDLPELEPVRMQFTNQFSADSTGIDLYYYRKLYRFFSLDLSNEITNLCDQQLLGLQGCYENLRASGEDEMAEMISKLMSRVDARRRAEIFAQLSQTDSNELSLLQDICAGSEYKRKKEDDDGEATGGLKAGAYDGQGDPGEEDYGDGEFVENAEVMDAIGLSIQNCQQSYIEYSGRMLEEGTTVLKSAEYEKSMSVIDMAAGGWGSQMETLLQELKHLYHIQDGIVADADAELQLLEGELLGKADAKYEQKLSEGAGGAYQAAEANGFSQAAKEQALKDQKADADAACTELQYLIQEKTKRQAAGDAAAFVYERIEHADSLSESIVADEFRIKAQESLDTHILWLKKLARSIEEEDEGSVSEMQKLEEQKEELLKRKADALDQNDLSLARKYDAMIEQVDAEVSKKEKELSAVLNSSSSSSAEKARAANQAGNTSVLNNISRIKDDVLEELAEDADDNRESITDKINALAALGAETALEEVRDKLSASGYEKLAEQAEEAAQRSRESSLHAQYGEEREEAGEEEKEQEKNGAESEGGNTPKEDGNAEAEDVKEEEQDLEDMAGGAEEEPALVSDETDLQAVIEEILGDSFENLDDGKKAVAAASMNRIGQSGNRAAGDLALQYMRACISEENGLVFRRLKGEAAEYIPLTRIADCAGYRYLYSDSETEVTLSRKSRVYRFVINSDKVKTANGSEEVLAAAVRTQSRVPYLSEEDAQNLFACTAEYMEDAEYGFCLDAKASDQVEAIVRRVLGEEE